MHYQYSNIFPLEQLPGHLNYHNFIQSTMALLECSARPNTVP